MPPRPKGPFPAAAADQPHVVVVLNRGEPVDLVGPFPARRPAKTWARHQLAPEWDRLVLPLIPPERYIPRVRRN
jgi:hypothetical protein